MPLMTDESKRSWRAKHNRHYHGSYEDVLKRNKGEWRQGATGDMDRVNLFRFTPKDKVICDIGAGGGWHGLECLRKGAKKVYLLEVDDTILHHMKLSFQALNIPEERYEIIKVDADVAVPEKLDIVYCMTVFQHISFSQACDWFRWIYANLKDPQYIPQYGTYLGGGVAHLQFHELSKITSFLDGRDNRPVKVLESTLKEIGFDILCKELATSPCSTVKLLPVWYLYQLERRRA